MSFLFLLCFFFRCLFSSSVVFFVPPVSFFFPLCFFSSSCVIFYAGVNFLLSVSFLFLQCFVSSARVLFSSRVIFVWLCSSGISVLHGLPILAEGCQDSNLVNDLYNLTRWVSLVRNATERDIDLTRAMWDPLIIQQGGGSQPTGPPLHTESKV